MQLESIATLKLSTHSLRIMRASAEAEGLAWAPLIDAARIAPALVDDPDGQITGVEELRLQQLFAVATRPIPGAWLRTGLRYRLMGYGALGLAVLAADTMAQGMRVLADYQALTYSLMQYRLLFDGAELVGMEADDSRAPLDPPYFREFCQERALGAVTRFLNDMLTPTPLVGIETVIDRPAGWLDCATTLGVPVRFNAPVTRWRFRAGVGSEPLPLASELLAKTYQSMCTRLIDEAGGGGDLAARLYTILAHAPRGFPAAAEAARALAISERTLHRRLATTRTSFGAVLDQVREDRARHLLLRSRASVARVAELLDFAETASFSRAFKRWTGLSPLKFRAAGENCQPLQTRPDARSKTRLPR